MISDRRPHSVEILFTDHIVLYYTKGLCGLLSGICYITRRTRKRIGLVVLCGYNYYCGLTKDQSLIRDLAFTFDIMLFPQATKQDRAFIQDQP